MALRKILCQPVTKAFLAVSALFFLLDHFLFWAVVKSWHGLSWAELLRRWDAGYYAQIVRDGYTNKTFAFFPLYPLLVKIVWVPLSRIGDIPPQMVGATVSTALFLAAVFVFSKLHTAESAANGLRKMALLPETAAGWLVFLYSPASYVFHSYHTEALFLLLSLFALVLAERRRNVAASLTAGLCALTRIQGVFLAIAVAVQLSSQEKRLAYRIRTFLVSGVISAALFGLYPLYQYFKTGDALCFLHAQTAWNHPTSTLAIYLRTFVFANPWQNTNLGSILHHVFFVALVAAAGCLIRRSPAIFAYLILNLAVMPMEGEFVNAFRFGAVLFPALFALGDTAARKMSPVLLGLYMAFVVLVNHAVAYNYVIGRWAY